TKKISRLKLSVKRKKSASEQRKSDKLRRSASEQRKSDKLRKKLLSSGDKSKRPSSNIVSSQGLGTMTARQHSKVRSLPGLPGLPVVLDLLDTHRPDRSPELRQAIVRRPAMGLTPTTRVIQVLGAMLPGGSTGGLVSETAMRE